MKNSNIASLDAANWTYEFEKVQIENIPKEDLLRKAQEVGGKKIPSNLEYLDSTYDNKTGTSGTAFLDKNTGEVIIA
ncbi:hypothetical protein [Streptococcus thoraltensis]|uniref:hypothetical protein n=1 Tax=Streptococcus TaxID=1301 RepID=UPI00036CE3FA|nr:hypothetical protein [Streptococcus thoraltensis]